MTRVVLADSERSRMRVELADELSPLSVDGHDTICNHLRLLYRTPLTDPQKELCEEIIFLAKKMSKKLEEFHSKGGSHYGYYPKG